MQFTIKKISLTELNLDKGHAGCHRYINNKIMVRHRNINITKTEQRGKSKQNHYYRLPFTCTYIHSTYVKNFTQQRDISRVTNKTKTRKKNCIN